MMRPMPSLRFRLQEAMAERFRWVQYPRLEQNRPRFFGIEQTKLYTFLFGRVDQQREPIRLRWTNQMPLWRRIVIFFGSLVLLCLAVYIAIFVMGPIYLMLRALFSS